MDVHRSRRRRSRSSTRRRRGSNYGKYSDPKVDELAERALKETNRDKRKQLYWELQRHLLARRTDARSRSAGWRAGSSRTRSCATTSPRLTAYDNNTFMKVWIAP